LLVVKLLKKAGVKEGEFQSANLSASKVLAALEAGDIDAGLLILILYRQTSY